LRRGTIDDFDPDIQLRQSVADFWFYFATIPTFPLSAAGRRDDGSVVRR